MKQDRCGLGITVRGIRRAFRDELQANEQLIRFIADVAGVAEVIEIGEIAMKNQGTDLHVVCVGADGAPIYIAVDVQVDKVWGDAVFYQDDETPIVERLVDDPHRTVTIAPEVWFMLKANAVYAQNMITFEQLEPLVSPEFLYALRDAERRATAFFEEMRRPKTKLPGWVWRQRARGPA